ncbi:aminoglycoside phosphotransferase family protein [Candidatus Woesearchaeota archaeon]|nr:aminoglycoside phosphotransferase family protein [Candidatus Woesearchaeota archaeon]
MTLDEHIKKIFEKKKGVILVVDTGIHLPYDPGLLKAEEIHKKQEQIEDFAELHGIDLKLHYLTQNDILRLNPLVDSISRYLKVSNDPALFLVMANSDMRLMGTAKGFAESGVSAALLEKKFPDVPLLFYVPKYDEEPLDGAMEQTLPIFLMYTPQFYERRQKLHIKQHPSLMHLLAEAFIGKDELDVSAHEYMQIAWKDNYLPFIDRSLRAGNSQSKMHYSFLVLSNAEVRRLGKEAIRAAEKVKLQKFNKALEKEDLSDCAAIFIDNSWHHSLHSGALGGGLKELERIRKILDKENLNIPIIYQSGHKSEMFSEEEKQKLNDLGAVLASKDIFPKVSQGALKAKKEAEISRILKTSSLKDIAPDVHIYDSQNGLHVVCSKIINGEAPSYEHKMRVLAEFHDIMKDHLDNEILAEHSVNLFRPFTKILLALRNHSSIEWFAESEPLYERLRQKHESLPATTIIHNDPKWDNWFGSALGDYGDCCAAPVYKDLARALLDEENAFRLVRNPGWVEKKVELYLDKRTKLDPEFKPEPDFKDNVKEVIFLESLRLARYKASTGSYDTMQELLGVATTYIKLLAKQDNTTESTDLVH